MKRITVTPLLHLDNSAAEVAYAPNMMQWLILVSCLERTQIEDYLECYRNSINILLESWAYMTIATTAAAKTARPKSIEAVYDAPLPETYG
jgi:hypothetical protein